MMLLYEFYYDVFKVKHYYGYEIEQQELKYKTEYISWPHKQDTDNLKYGYTKYYTDDEDHKLIATKVHNGDDYNFIFTKFAFNYYSNLLLDEYNRQFQKYSVIKKLNK